MITRNSHVGWAGGSAHRLQAVAVFRTTVAEVGGLSYGQRVGHAKFGEGVVLQLEGEGSQEADANQLQAGWG